MAVYNAYKKGKEVDKNDYEAFLWLVKTVLKCANSSWDSSSPAQDYHKTVKPVDIACALYMMWRRAEEGSGKVAGAAGKPRKRVRRGAKNGTDDPSVATTSTSTTSGASGRGGETDDLTVDSSHGGSEGIPSEVEVDQKEHRYTEEEKIVMLKEIYVNTSTDLEELEKKSLAKGGDVRKELSDLVYKDCSIEYKFPTPEGSESERGGMVFGDVIIHEMISGPEFDLDEDLAVEAVSELDIVVVDLFGM